MANGRPSNLLEVLFKSGAAGLAETGRQLPAQREQERSDALAQFGAIMQFQQQEQATQAHGQRMALGRANLDIANKKLSELNKSQFEIGKGLGEQKLGFLEGLGDITPTEKQTLGVPLTLREQADIAGGFLREDPLLKSARAGDITLTRQTAGAGVGKLTQRDKTIASKKQRFSPETFAINEDDYRAGRQPGKKEFSDYQRIVKQLLPTDFFGKLEADTEEIRRANAQAAGQTGYSPVAGGTLGEVLERLEERMATGGTIVEDGKRVKLTEENIGRAKQKLRDHFENLFQEVLNAKQFK